MALRIRRRMRILVFGDSKTKGGSATDQVKWFVGIRDYLRALWGADAPTWIASGVAGQAVNAALARLAADCYPVAPDIIINAYGTNDALTAIASASFRADYTTLVTNQKTASNYSNRTPPTQIALVEIPCIGEKWPDGANAFDIVGGGPGVGTGISAKNGDIATVCAATGAELLTLRSAVMAYETKNNPSNAGSGILMTTADGTTGKHEIALGATVEASILIPQLSIDQ